MVGFDFGEIQNFADNNICVWYKNSKPSPFAKKTDQLIVKFIKKLNFNYIFILTKLI